MIPIYKDPASVAPAADPTGIPAAQGIAMTRKLDISTGIDLKASVLKPPDIEADQIPWIGLRWIRHNEFVLLRERRRSHDRECDLGLRRSCAVKASDNSRSHALLLRRSIEILRNQHDVAMPYASFRDDMLGEMPELGGPPLEHRHLHATLLVQMNVKRSDWQLVMMVIGAGQFFGQFTGLVIVDVDNRRDTLGLWIGVLGGPLDAGTHQISNSFGAILVATHRDELIEFRH